jgi:DNA polymerase/3'-5' exonuclease PolX
MFKVNINTCAYQDLRALPGIGQAIADRIWELRKEGHIDENCHYTQTEINQGIIKLH